MQNSIKICIVDDHRIFREGLKFVLQQINDFEVIGEHENGRDFLEWLNSHQPDIVLMDISMPELDGIQTTEVLRKRNPGIKIIALSSYGDELYYYKMIKAGVNGFVEKKSGKMELENAIHAVMAGSNYFPPQHLQKIILKLSESGEESLSRPETELTKREIEILSLICQGYSNNEIADILFLSPKTIDNHRTNLLTKTASKNTASLVMYAIKNKLVSF